MPMLTAPPAAVAAAAKTQPKPPTHEVVLTPPSPPARDSQGRIALSARLLKVTVVLDAAQLAAVPPPAGQRTELRIAVGDRIVAASVNSKSFRKVLSTIAEHGPDGVAVVLQGKLVREGGVDTVAEAGITGQVKVAKDARPRG